MSWDLYSCRRCGFYRSMHSRRPGEFVPPIQDRHLLFLTRGLPAHNWRLRVQVLMGVNDSDGYAFPPWNERPLPTIPRNPMRFVVLDAPVAERGSVVLWVYHGGGVWAIDLDGGGRPGSGEPAFPQYNRRLVYGRSDFSTTSPRLDVLAFGVWQGSAVWSPGSWTTSDPTGAGRSSETSRTIQVQGTASLAPGGLGVSGQYWDQRVIERETATYAPPTISRADTDPPRVVAVQGEYHMVQLRRT
jgi:hypothetical protein